MNNENVAEQVHIIPLGHEYDRAVATFHSRKADRAYVLAVPAGIDFDPEMLRRQNHFSNKVLDELKRLDIPVRFCEVNLFDIKETMKALSSIIKLEKDAGNRVLVNMSACGRKTSYAATLSAMVHQVPAYYVSASGYIGGSEETSDNQHYFDHGISIVEDFTKPPELLYNFRIMMPKPASLDILKAIFQSRDKYCTLQDIIRLFHKNGVDGYEKMPAENKKGNFTSGNDLRSLMNKTNRLYLRDLEAESTRYITRKKVGKEYRFSLTNEGEIIVCISGLLDPPTWTERRK